MGVPLVVEQASCRAEDQGTRVGALQVATRRLQEAVDRDRQRRESKLKFTVPCLYEEASCGPVSEVFLMSPSFTSSHDLGDRCT